VWIRPVGLSLALAAVVVPENAWPEWAQPLVGSAYLVGPFLIGMLAGWRTLPSFAAAYLVVAILYQLLLWEDDPRLSGIDDIPPIAGVVFVMPFLLVPMALGAAARKFWLTSREQRGHA
jgi:hypothetical protein